ncbi:hypothetical protein ACFFJY_04845 [Fictibacillus aquaticus]|uniref:RsgI N-terminal anti-sigma domain-containing protein n=1 Tax=Fictibacillus aquaticus TaxID=2021314 RepID=A0A235F5D2_9BACL|nr:hypothetical protein [Fictibacillus aquaticus]OYD56127.1 hypothetical protein CGZ90_19195 [Fictibacillus aquaticus]
MKTGIVMEISKGKAVLLLKDGNFVTYRIPKGKQPQIGHEYTADFFKDPYRFQFLFPSFSLSLAAVLTFILYNGSLPLSRTESVAAYVSFDINPSLEVAVAEDLRILHVTAYNKDAKAAVERIGNAEGYTLSEYASELMADYEREGYFTANHELMVVTARKPKTSDSVKKKLDQSVKVIMKRAEKKHHVAVSSAAAEIKTRNEAKKKGITAGKYSLYLNARKNNHSLSIKDADKMTVKQLKKAAEESSSERESRSDNSRLRGPSSKKIPAKQNRMKVNIAGGQYKKKEDRPEKIRFKENKDNHDKALRKKSVMIVEKRDHSSRQENWKRKSTLERQPRENNNPKEKQRQKHKQHPQHRKHKEKSVKR